MDEMESVAKATARGEVKQSKGARAVVKSILHARTHGSSPSATGGAPSFIILVLGNRDRPQDQTHFLYFTANHLSLTLQVQVSHPIQINKDEPRHVLGWISSPDAAWLGLAWLAATLWRHMHHHHHHTKKEAAQKQVYTSNDQRRPGPGKKATARTRNAPTQRDPSFRHAGQCT